MSCPDSSCNPAPSLGSWTFTANPSANQFCDDRLIGLAQSDASGGTTLTAVDPITGCLTRPSTIKGIWQHDPDGCLPDYVGPLDALDFINIPAFDAEKTHGLPVWQKSCGGTVSQLVNQVPVPGNLGQPAMFRNECCTDATRWAVMAPEFLVNGRQTSEGTCVSPRVLAFIPYERTVCDGKVVTEYRWYSMDKWQQSDALPALETDIYKAGTGQTQNLWLAGWRDEGCPSGSTKVKQLVKIDRPQLERILELANGGVLTDPVQIYLQYALVNGAVTQPGITYYPALPSAGASIVSNSVDYNLNSIPLFKPGIHTGVIVRIQMLASGFTQKFDTVMVINGTEYCRTTVVADNGSDANYTEATIRVPADGILHLNYWYQISIAGNAAGVIARAHVIGFIR